MTDRPPHPSWVLVGRIGLRAAVALAVAGVLVACRGDGPSSVVFEGQRYQGLDTEALAITDADLREIGTADDTSQANAAASNAVYELAGVSTEDAIVMRADPEVFDEDKPFHLYVSDGFPPALCEYIRDPSRTAEVCR